MNKINVIIVEDDPMVAEINKEFVESVPGFKIIGMAKNGREGLELIDVLNPNLIIVDIFMPEMNGLEFIKTIRQRGISVDAIVISASDQPLHIQECMRLGIVDYLIKPFKKERLFYSLTNYIKVRYNLDKQKKITQNDIDNIISKGSVTYSNNLPKGLTEVTLNKIEDFLMNNKQLYSAEEIGSKVGISRVTTHRYLEYLHKLGKVSIDVNYGSVGRPLKMYKLSNS
ncbi:response regulator [Clostridium sediminicola]|uniref:response regulator n=1 Tax=Clostridium sediminicola TaxID=3114879 RepID=UPI0031F20A1F